MSTPMADIQSHPLWAARTCPCRAPRPLTTKPLAVPPHHGIGLHDHDGGAPLLPRLGEKDPKESVPRTELWAPGRTRQRGQLLTKRESLERDRPVSAADQSDRSEEHEQRRQQA